MRRNNKPQILMYKCHNAHNRVALTHLCEQLYIWYKTYTICTTRSQTIPKAHKTYTKSRFIK
jgi:hypothetical protein